MVPMSLVPPQIVVQPSLFLRRVPVMQVHVVVAVPVVIVVMAVVVVVMAVMVVVMAVVVVIMIASVCVNEQQRAERQDGERTCRAHWGPLHGAAPH